MSEFDLIIFDCDGVLVDTKPIECEIVTRVMNDLGVPLTPNDVLRQSAGTTDAQMWAKFEHQYECVIDEGTRDLYWQLVTEAWRERLRPVAGVREVLEALSRAHVPLCVASSGVPAQMEVTLGATKLDIYFGRNVFSTEQVTNGKPAPDVFLFAANQMGVQPSQCAVVEDGLAGMLGGLAAGMRVFAYVAMEQRDLDGLDVERFDDMSQLASLLL